MKALWISVAAVAWGCSPALNWRDVSVGSLTTMLPCKPDTALRDVQLGEFKAPLSMAGCEADGKLFAVSWLPLADTAQTESYVSIWKDQALARMKSTAGDVWNITSTAQGLRVIAATRSSGRDGAGQAIEARLVWLASKDALFHIAAYGPHLEDASLEMLTSQLRLGAGAAP